MDNIDARRTKSFLRLHLTGGLGVTSAHRLLGRFKDPASIFVSTVEELELLGIPPEVGRDLLSPRSGERADQEFEQAKRQGIEILDLHGDGYPALLRQIYDPPLVLYARGARRDFNQPQIAVVGTRRPSPYGINCAERLAEDLASRGLIVTSGLARGLDAGAHRGALRGGGITYAVSGCGVDQIYPRQNRGLAENVEKNGALLSEFPMGTAPRPENFPIRNRIIAGMSFGVVVVEAAEHSGSLITARCALEYGRDVFAVPGPIASPGSFGPHALIQQGAKLVASWKDVAEELPGPIREKLLSPLLANLPPPAEIPEGVARRILQLLTSSAALSIDEILENSASDRSAVYASLLDLEVRGLIRELPGRKYVKRM